MIEKRKVIIFPNPSKSKIYMTDEDNFDSKIFDRFKVTELENFIDLDDAKEYIERFFGYDVEIKNF